MTTLSCSSFASPPIWQDEFDQPSGSAPDAAKWSHDLGADGWGNAELQEYTAARENSFVVEDAAALNGKALVLRAVRKADGGYTSARIKTSGKFSVTYGRIEARMKLPHGQGIWPAFWMLADRISTVGWPQCGEIDIVEVVGHEPHKLHGTLHGPGYSGPTGLSKSTTLPGNTSLADGYHVYAIEWSPGRIEWSLDGNVYAVRTPADLPNSSEWVFDDASYFLILNLAVGGYWPQYPNETTTFPQELRIDYVRVFAPKQ